jgi:hypothetical protein
VIARKGKNYQYIGRKTPELEELLAKHEIVL